MKPTTLFRTLLLMLLAAMGNSAMAQYKSFFGDSITEYNITADPVFKYDDSWLGVDTYVFEICKKDTVTINGIRYYHNIEYTPTWYVYLREDTTLGRIYRYAPLGEILICDMSMSVGDTFFVPFSGMNCDYAVNREPLPIIADTIFYINGLKHIQFRTLYEETDVYFDDHGNPDTVVIPMPYLRGFSRHGKPIMFIEGIGPNFGPEGANWTHDGGSGSWLENGQLEYGYNPFLLCVHKDGELAFMSDERAGCWQFSIGSDIRDENQKTTLKLYPNPAHNTLTVESASPVREITVYDQTGRTVAVETWCTTSLQQIVNTASLHNGIYILKVVTDNGTETAKFVKK